MLHQETWSCVRTVWVILRTQSIYLTHFRGIAPGSERGSVTTFCHCHSASNCHQNTLTSSGSQCQMLRVDVPTVHHLTANSKSDGWDEHVLISNSGSSKDPQRVLKNGFVLCRVCDRSSLTWSRPSISPFPSKLLAWSARRTPRQNPLLSQPQPRILVK